MRNHDWCQNIPRDEAVRAAEDSRTGPLPTLEEAIGMLPKTGSATSAVEQENKGNDMETNGLRTERVTLEITLDARRLHHIPAWNDILPAALALWPTESVRVVEERVGSVDERAYADRMGCDEERDFAYRILAEKAAAIREREELRGELERANDKHQSYRHTALARITSLESQLESVADRAAAAETALESAPAASGAAERIAAELLRSGGLADTVQRLEAMSQDPGRAVVWEEFDDTAGVTAKEVGRDPS